MVVRRIGCEFAEIRCESERFSAGRAIRESPLRVDLRFRYVEVIEVNLSFASGPWYFAASGQVCGGGKPPPTVKWRIWRAGNARPCNTTRENWLVGATIGRPRGRHCGFAEIRCETGRFPAGRAIRESPLRVDLRFRSVRPIEVNLLFASGPRYFAASGRGCGGSKPPPYGEMAYLAGGQCPPLQHDPGESSL